MDDDRERREDLVAAGYTDTRGAVIFCVLLAALGALLGSVIFAILWLWLVPGSSDALSTTIGALAGAVLAVAIGLLKVRQGNLDAREMVEDREWKRLLRRQHGSRAR